MFQTTNQTRFQWWKSAELVIECKPFLNLNLWPNWPRLRNLASAAMMATSPRKDHTIAVSIRLQLPLCGLTWFYHPMLWAGVISEVDGAGGELSSASVGVREGGVRRVEPSRAAQGWCRLLCGRGWADCGAWSAERGGRKAPTPSQGGGHWQHHQWPKLGFDAEAVLSDEAALVVFGVLFISDGETVSGVGGFFLGKICVLGVCKLRIRHRPIW